jgi:hypothetical protein
MQVTVPGSKIKHCIEEQISEEVRCGLTDGQTAGENLQEGRNSNRDGE